MLSKLIIVALTENRKSAALLLSDTYVRDTPNYVTKLPGFYPTIPLF